MAERYYNPETKRMEVLLPGMPKPTLSSMAASLGRAAIDTAKRVVSGQKPLATDEVVTERKETCLACLNWNPRGYGGTGKCEACGCSALKLTLAASKCPLSKWVR